MAVRVQRADFDLAHEINGFGESGQTGALVSFVGLVRQADHGQLAALELEHYPAMTEKALSDIERAARARWQLNDVLIIHRYGEIAIGAQIMMVATAARHRDAAFESADFLMDYLKSRAPFWKREILRDGTYSWVEARKSDEASLARWTEIGGSV